MKSILTKTHYACPEKLMELEGVDPTGNNINVPCGTLSQVHAYDYIKDLLGNVYIVRGVIYKTNEIIIKPIAIYKTSDLEKFDPNDQGHLKQIPYSSYEWGDPDNYSCKLEDIESLFKRDQVLNSDHPNNPKLLRDVIETISCDKIKVYLFGSRRLNLENQTSDWDILIISNSHYGEIVDKLVTNLEGRVRLFNRNECLKRANHYAWPCSHLNKQFLIKAFQKTTSYLKTEIGEVGIFFASNTDTCLPYIDSTKISEHHLRGRIIRSDGSSHLMPRNFLIQCSDGEIKKVGTIMWGLGGIEECAGEYVSLRGLEMLSKDSYWLGGSSSSLEFI